MVAGLLALLLAFPDTTPVAAAAHDSAPLSSAVGGVHLVNDSTPPPLAAIRALPVTLPAGRHVPIPAEWLAPIDTEPRRRARAVQYSEWYGRRVAVHKALSWAMLPLFGVSYYTGTQLADKGRAGVSSTVRTLHPIAAGGAAAVFGVNTVTGLWNLWDSRRDPADRKRRYLHSALFLLADAGFAYAGSLGEEAGEDGEVRSRHRNIAIGSMGLSTAGWLVMLLRK